MWHEERLLVGGELVPAEGNRTYPTIDPSTGKTLGEAADASVGDARGAVESARRAFDTTGWATDHAFRATACASCGTASSPTRRTCGRC